MCLIKFIIYLMIICLALMLCYSLLDENNQPNIPPPKIFDPKSTYGIVESECPARQSHSTKSEIIGYCIPGEKLIIYERKEGFYLAEGKYRKNLFTNQKDTTIEKYGKFWIGGKNIDPKIIK